MHSSPQWPNAGCNRGRLDTHAKLQTGLEAFQDIHFRTASLNLYPSKLTKFLPNHHPQGRLAFSCSGLCKARFPSFLHPALPS